MSVATAALPTEINGLPAHVLLIHAIIVLLPLAAIMLVAGAVWPAARRKLGVLSPMVALVALVLVPITTNAGEWLRDRIPPSKAIEKHTELGDTLLPWAIGILVVSAAVWLLGRRFDTSWRPRPGSEADTDADADGATGGGTATLTKPETRTQALPVWAAAIVAFMAIGVSVGAMVQLYRIGDSGASAVWNYVHDLPSRGGG